MRRLTNIQCIEIYIENMLTGGIFLFKNLHVQFTVSLISTLNVLSRELELNNSNQLEVPVVNQLSSLCCFWYFSRLLKNHFITLLFYYLVVVSLQDYLWLNLNLKVAICLHEFSFSYVFPFFSFVFFFGVGSTHSLHSHSWRLIA